MMETVETPPPPSPPSEEEEDGDDGGSPEPSNPFDWKRGAAAGGRTVSFSPEIVAGGDAGRRNGKRGGRAMSLPAVSLLLSSTSSASTPSALLGVTVNQDTHSISAALSEARSKSQTRLRKLSVCTDTEEAGEEDEAEVLRRELQDREQQILQAVELGGGLLEQLEEERQRHRREAAEANAELTRYKTSLLYLLSVEEALESSAAENEALRGEAALAENLKWIEATYNKDSARLTAREQHQERQEKEVLEKLRQLDRWKARAARADRLEAEAKAWEERAASLEKEKQRLNGILRARDSCIYELKSDAAAAARGDQWDRQMQRAEAVRLKRENALLRQELEEVSVVSLPLPPPPPPPPPPPVPPPSTLPLNEVWFARLSREVDGFKDEVYGEAEKVVNGVKDLVRDYSRQCAATHRLREEIADLRQKAAAAEAACGNEGETRGRRGHVVSLSASLHRSLTDMRDYSKGVRIQAAVRQITEREAHHLSQGLVDAVRDLDKLLHLTLSVGEKKRAGLPLTGGGGGGGGGGRRCGHADAAPSEVRATTAADPPQPILRNYLHPSGIPGRVSRVF